MVKKLKVVDVEEVKPAEELIENKIEPEIESSSSSEEVKPEAQAPEIENVEMVEKVEKVEEPKTKKQSEYITCETCNKKILMKPYKYSHQKLCKENAPPPPPPAPEPKPRPKRVTKPKQPIDIPKEQPKPESSGVVSFDGFQDPYRTMREQRLMVRQQRVKSLISQAI